MKQAQRIVGKSQGLGGISYISIRGVHVNIWGLRLSAYEKLNIWSLRIEMKLQNKPKFNSKFQYSRHILAAEHEKAATFLRHIEKLFSSDTRQSTKRRIVTERFK